MIWSSASLSHVGKVREVNEDACIERPEIGIWAVADGMGGHKEGALASRLIVEALAQVRQHGQLSQLVNDVEDRLRDVHAALLMRSDGDSVIGSTVAVMIVMHAHCVLLWVGDSRVYRLRDNRLEQLTQDHSYVEELVEFGSLTREEAESHPEANIITRAVGAGDELYLDAKLEDFYPKDHYLLCSDGLYRELLEEELAQALASPDCKETCEKLITLVLERGAKDNVTVVSVAMEEQVREIDNLGPIEELTK